MFQSIPVYTVATGLWTRRDFPNRADLLSYLLTLFKEPGQYEFDNTSLHFNKQARRYTQTKLYCTAPYSTKDYITYWDTEKDKCRQGVIFIGENQTEWYLTRDYYMWLNFLPIYDKEKARFDFPMVRDAQYHMALYEDIAKLSYKHAAILKKRQIASSYFHAAKMINYFWFEEGWINKMAASLKDYINEKGTWRFLEEYRNFLNEHTAWYRPCTPDKVLNWEQKIETTLEGGKKVDKGNKSVIFGLVLEKDPTNGVGGPCSLFFHEEAGVAKHMNETMEYLLPAMKSGMIYTGMAVCAGSVGKLAAAEPLKEMILHPDSKDVLAVQTNLLDSKGTLAMCGLFIPEQWSMKPYIDRHGNSIIFEPTPEQIPDLLANWIGEAAQPAETFNPKQGALGAILAEREVWKKSVSPADYQLRISQKPTNIEEAFASREASAWPLHLVSKQIERIQNRDYFLEYKDIVRGDNGKPEWKDSKRLPISEFPISARSLNKEGTIVVHEKPIEGAAWGTYVASIDPVASGKTTTSDSLCSIYIYKNDVEVSRDLGNGKFEHELEPGKLVAWWCGRYDDLNKTHERLSLMLEMYNAQAVVENNVMAFIQYMIEKNRQKYLVRKDQMLFLKELSANTSVFQDYGWKNVGTLFTTSMIPFAAQALKEELNVETDEQGEIISTRFGIERFPDIMLMKEMQAYRKGLNVDRLIAFSALMSYVQIQRSNRSGAFKRKEISVSNLEKSPKNANLNAGRNMFRHIGQPQLPNVSEPGRRIGSGPAPRTPFRNIR